MAKADKEAARRDYGAGMTLRAVALKYGVSKSLISKWAKAEGWTKGVQVDERPPQDVRPPIELPDLPPEDKHTSILQMGNRLLDRVGEALESPEPISARDLRGLAATLLDVRQLINAVSPIEAEEQRLRIEGLRRQIEDTQSGEDVTVRIMGMTDAEVTEAIK